MSDKQEYGKEAFLKWAEENPQDLKTTIEELRRLPYRIWRTTNFTVFPKEWLPTRWYGREPFYPNSIGHMSLDGVFQPEGKRKGVPGEHLMVLIVSWLGLEDSVRRSSEVEWMRQAHQVVETWCDERIDAAEYEE